MILMYHNVVPVDAPPGYRHQSITLDADSFCKHLLLLKQHFNVIPLGEYVILLHGSDHIPKRTVAITFDDGTAMTYKSILPVISSLDLPVTIFVATSQIDDGPLIWGSYLNALCFEDVYPEIIVRGTSYPCRTPREKQMSHSRIVAAARETQNPEGFVDMIRDEYPIPSDIKAYYSGMTSVQLRHASANELVTIGAHTVSHPFLSLLPVAEQEAELRESKARLEEITEKEVHYFAYPSSDYSDETIGIVRDTGFRAAFAVTPRRRSANTALFEIPRIGIFSPSRLKLAVKLVLNSA